MWLLEGTYVSGHCYRQSFYCGFLFFGYYFRPFSPHMTLDLAIWLQPYFLKGLEWCARVTLMYLIGCSHGISMLSLALLGFEMFWTVILKKVFAPGWHVARLSSRLLRSAFREVFDDLKLQMSTVFFIDVKIYQEVDIENGECRLRIGKIHPCSVMTFESHFPNKQPSFQS